LTESVAVTISIVLNGAIICRLGVEALPFNAVDHLPMPLELQTMRVGFFQHLEHLPLNTCDCDR
jgi:hypothetical protein